MPELYGFLYKAEDYPSSQSSVPRVREKYMMTGSVLLPVDQYALNGLLFDSLITPFRVQWLTATLTTILDKMNGIFPPPLPPISMMLKWRVLVFARLHHCLGGGGGVIVPFYSVQDCRTVQAFLGGHSREAKKVSVTYGIFVKAAVSRAVRLRKRFESKYICYFVSNFQLFLSFLFFF